MNAAMRSLTAEWSYFEDLPVGRTIRHHRGKTVTEIEGVIITNLVVNTAQAHFNEHSMASQPIGERIVFGGVTASVVVGLASQDASDNVLRELSLENMKLSTPVVHGDTLYAFTEVMDATPLDAESGEVLLHHWGINQRNDIVFEADRRLIVRRRRPADLLADSGLTTHEKSE
jgi:itaconyl-CoA hydratase